MKIFTGNEALLRPIWHNRQKKYFTVSFMAKVIPELKANFLSHWLYEWMTPIVWQGYKKPYEQDDLYELGEDFKAEKMALDFSRIWDEEQKLLDERKAAATGGASENIPEHVTVTRVLYRQFGRLYSIIGVFHLIQAAANISSPLIVGALTQFVENMQSGGDKPPMLQGYLYAFVFLLLQLVATVGLNRYFYYATRIGLQARSVLTAVIYRKMMKLSGISRQKFSGGRIVNMVSSDLSRLEMTFGQGHYIWSGPLQIVAILILLISRIGVSALAGVAILIFMVPVQARIFIALGVLRQQVAGISDSRIRMTQEFLQGMRIIKLFAWEDSFMQRLMDLRVTEVKKIQFVGMWTAVLMGFSTSVPVLASVISFIIYATTTGGDLKAPIIFTAFGLFNLLRFPMILLPSTIRQFIESNIALKRMTEYLNAEELDPKSVEGDPNPEYAIEIEDGTFRWEVYHDPATGDKKSEIADKKPINDTKAKSGSEKYEMQEKLEGSTSVPVDALKGINLKVKKGDLVVIIGPVGSGKSSLLGAILGEIKKVSGHVKVNGNIGYSLQQPWVQNGSLLNNITFGKDFDEEKYNQVIQVTTLDRDIQWLPAGNQTLLGEKGVQISGGQKARVSLSRVVYGGPDIVLLDDPISAVDVHVGKHIFKHCIKDALKDKTTLLVTHNLNCVKDADYIVYMKDGMIVEQGTYDDLISSSGETAKLVASYAGGADKDQEQVEVVKVNDETVGKLQKQGQTMLEEERVLGSVSSNVYKEYLEAAGGIWAVIMAIFLIVLVQATRLGNDLWLVYWTDGTLTERHNLSISVIMGIYFAWGLSQGIMAILLGVSLSYAFERASRLFHKEALAGIFRAPITFFDTTPLGRIVNRFSKDTDTMDSLLPMSLQMFLSIFSGLVGYLILMCFASPYLLIPLVPLSSIYYIMQQLYLRTSRELKRIESISRSPIYAHYSESMTGLSTIRAYKVQDRFIVDMDKRVNDNNKAMYLQLMTQRWLGIRLEFLGSIISLFTALFGVIFSSTAEAALVGLSLAYAIQITSSLNFSVRQAAEVEVNANSIERLHHYARNLDQEAPYKRDDNKPKDSWPEQGCIEVENLEIKYSSSSGAVLKNISFSVNSKEKIGVVGRTGAGKSTITYSLFRLLEASRGKITIDGLDISELGLYDLRSRLAIIPQDPVLFSGTIRTNLDPFNQYDDQNIWRVLESCNLKPAISKLQDGLESKVDANGENFSTGQRQLVCLARAMLRNPRVLVMDEATANVDMVSDELIQKALRQDFKESTIFTIAHRLNTVMDYDKILVLDKGEISEYDTPNNLLLKETGLFVDMVNQTGSSTAKFLRKIAAEKAAGHSISVHDLVDAEKNISMSA